MTHIPAPTHASHSLYHFIKQFTSKEGVISSCAGKGGGGVVSAAIWQDTWVMMMMMMMVEEHFTTASSSSTQTPPHLRSRSQYLSGMPAPISLLARRCWHCRSVSVVQMGVWNVIVLIAAQICCCSFKGKVFFWVVKVGEWPERRMKLWELV